jgi:drug/metabolite transporter (DMT)-like permease
LLEGLVLAVCAAIIYGFLGIVFEVAGKRRYKIWDVMLYKQITGACIGAVACVMIHSRIYHPYLLGLGSIGAAGYVVTLAVYLTASREQNIAANWTIINLSVIVPVLVSIFWFHDHVTTGKVAGVIVTLASILLIGQGVRGLQSNVMKSKWFACIVTAFLFNSWLLILFRFVPAGQEAAFTVYFYILSIPMILAVKLKTDRNWHTPPNVVVLSAAGAATHWSGIMLTMLALHRVSRVSLQPGVVVYPITNGLVIPIGVILGFLLLKQRVNGWAAAGIGFGMLGLILLSLG